MRFDAATEEKCTMGYKEENNPEKESQRPHAGEPPEPIHGACPRWAIHVIAPSGRSALVLIISPRAQRYLLGLFFERGRVYPFLVKVVSAANGYVNSLRAWRGALAYNTMLSKSRRADNSNKSFNLQL